MKHSVQGGMTCEMAQRAIALAAMSTPSECAAEYQAAHTRTRDARTATAGSPVHTASAHASAASFPTGSPSIRRSLTQMLFVKRASGSEGAHVSVEHASFDLSANLPALSQNPADEDQTEEELAAELAMLLGCDPSALLDGHAGHGTGAGGGLVPEARAGGAAAMDPALAAHLKVCRSCQAEMAATTAFFRALANEPGPEPSATLLARSRMQLDASLDSCEYSGLWARLSQQLSFTAGRLRAAPALCSALLLVGLLAGGYGGYRAGQDAHMARQTALLLAPPAPEAPSVVADVTSISRDPSTGLVEVRYDRLVPDVLTARPEDPSIRELLMAATENGTDPQVRNLSVNLLSGSCPAGAPCDAAPVRNALLNVLSSDKTPQVRREALASLQPFLAEDMQVRDAVLTAVMSDPSAAVRIEAVRLLESIDVDSSVRQALHTVASEDGDPRIRSASMEALRAVPQVQ